MEGSLLPPYTFFLGLLPYTSHLIPSLSLPTFTLPSPFPTSHLTPPTFFLRAARRGGACGDQKAT